MDHSRNEGPGKDVLKSEAWGFYLFISLCPALFKKDLRQLMKIHKLEQRNINEGLGEGSRVSQARRNLCPIGAPPPSASLSLGLWGHCQDPRSPIRTCSTMLEMLMLVSSTSHMFLGVHTRAPITHIHCEYKLAYVHTCTHGHAYSYAYITHSMQVYLHTHADKRTHATHIHTCTHNTHTYNTYAHTHTSTSHRRTKPPEGAVCFLHREAWSSRKALRFGGPQAQPGGWF